MDHTFFTHGWCDEAIVANFAQDLEAGNIKVFLDQWDIKTGQMVWAGLDKAIDSAHKMVLFLSRKALEGNGVQDELDRALQKMYEKCKENFVLPVALDHYDEIAPQLSVRIRGANMIRAYDLGFAPTVEALDRAILDKPAPRIAPKVPLDFYYRLYEGKWHDKKEVLVVELGSAVRTQEGFTFETVWSEPVYCPAHGLGSVQKPESMAGFTILEMRGQIPAKPADAGANISATLVNQTIRRGVSYYMVMCRPDGIRPAPPISASLGDQFRSVIVANLPLF